NYIADDWPKPGNEQDFDTLELLHTNSSCRSGLRFRQDRPTRWARVGAAQVGHCMNASAAIWVSYKGNTTDGLDWLFTALADRRAISARLDQKNARPYGRRRSFFTEAFLPITR